MRCLNNRPASGLARTGPPATSAARPVWVLDWLGLARVPRIEVRGSAGDAGGCDQGSRRPAPAGTGRWRWAGSTIACVSVQVKPGAVLGRPLALSQRARVGLLA